MAENNQQCCPNHVAVILDGNGRWAKERNLPHVEGHKAGALNVKCFLETVSKYPVKYLTLYAFSTENWKRPKEEVDALMILLVEFINTYLDELMKHGIRLRATGRLDELPAQCRASLESAFEKTRNNTRYTLILALNYGGRAELADAMRKIAEQVKNGTLNPGDISEEMISQNLYLPDVPDPDLLIRTSGEIRLSNFLLWQLSYTEFYFTDVLWPDFDENEFKKAIETYNGRKRRYGGRIA